MGGGPALPGGAALISTGRIMPIIRVKKNMATADKRYLQYEIL
jgi:hypothetical protein